MSATIVKSKGMSEKQQTNHKWLYRLESTDDGKGLWNNASGEYVFGIGNVENCISKEMPMG